MNKDQREEMKMGRKIGRKVGRKVGRKIGRKVGRKVASEKEEKEQSDEENAETVVTYPDFYDTFDGQDRYHNQNFTQIAGVDLTKPAAPYKPYYEIPVDETAPYNYRNDAHYSNPNFNDRYDTWDTQLKYNK